MDRADYRKCHAAFADYHEPLEFSYEYLDTKRQQESPAYYRLHADLMAHIYRVPGQGTSFHILLPLHTSPAAPQEEQQKLSVTAKNGETTLLVEEDPKILQMTATRLELFGYRVITASLPSEALRQAEEHHGAIDVLITDVITGR